MLVSHGALLILQQCTLDMVVHACSLGTGKVEKGGSEVHSHPWLHVQGQPGVHKDHVIKQSKTDKQTNKNKTTYTHLQGTMGGEGEDELFLFPVPKR